MDKHFNPCIFEQTIFSVLLFAVNQRFKIVYKVFVLYSYTNFIMLKPFKSPNLLQNYLVNFVIHVCSHEIHPFWLVTNIYYNLFSSTIPFAIY